MVYSGQMSWKEVAWNEIQFLVPADWEVSSIGSHYLMLEEESGPIFEVKWGQIRGNFSHKVQLQRINALIGKLPRKTVKECPLPHDLKKALGAFKSTGFSWGGESIGGLGVILFCPECRKATLIQFFQRNSVVSEDIYRSILTSFQDHRQDAQVVWSVFDIRAKIPKNLRLVRHCLEPGRFELAFESNGQKITLYRWGPASVLLQDQDLLEFARTVAGFYQDKPHSMIESGSKVVEWETSPPISGWQRLLSRILAKHSFQWVRLWHLVEKNRILAIRATGKKPLDFHLLERIFTDYESL
jgi:hypothetical protein